MPLVPRRAVIGRLALIALATTSLATTSLATFAASHASAAASDIRINEVESNGGSPGDWVELFNSGTGSVDISGWKFLDSDNTHTPYAIPAGTLLAPGAFYVVEEAQFVFGLGTADSARLFAADGTTLIDSYAWTAHATITYGRCPDGTGSFVQTASTKGAANSCGAPGTTTTTTPPAGLLPWPGDAAVQTADNLNVFGGNLSGLVYEPSGTAAKGVIWGARNGPGALFRLVFDGANNVWVPDTSNGWGAGKLLRYPNGTGDPDAEGVTLGGPTAASGIYVSTERNNAANSVSRNAILRFDAGAAGSTLTATNEWDLTADLPVTGANLGMEAITFIPDSYLVAHGFLDESKHHTYAPAEYPDHAGGLFFVGLEANGTIYAYALDHVGGGFTRVATIASGFPAVMDLQLDRDLGDLWAVCDDTCLGRHAVLRISPTTGAFAGVAMFDRPGGMPNLNNEGFAIAPAAECVADRKPVFWADDSETGGHALRTGNLPCSAVVAPPADVPEFPASVLASACGAVLVAGWFLVRRRPRTTA